MTPKGRDIKDDPWLWASKAQADNVLKNCGTLAAGRMALVVYITLARIASDNGDVASFTLSQTEVAIKAGLTDRAIRKAINSLCACGALSYEVKFFGGMGTWTLLSPSTLTKKRPLGTGVPPPPEQNGSLTVPTYKERKEIKGNPKRILTDEERKANLASMEAFKR